MNTPQVDWAEPIKTDDRDEYIRELEAKLAEKENPTTGNETLDNMVAMDKNTKIIEVGGTSYVLKRRPHSQWLKYFGKIMSFTTGDTGGSVMEINDLGVASEFVFDHMLVRPKVGIDEVENFTDLMEITMEGISFQMTSGN